MNANLFHALTSGFPEDQKATALALPNGAALTFKDLLDGAGRMASLLKDLDVAPGDRVMVQAAKSPECVMLYLACLQAGAIYLPLNTAYRGEELDYFTGDAEPAVIVCDPSSEALLAEIADRHGGATVLTLDGAGRGTLTDRAATHEPSRDVAAVEPDDIAAIVYTSGTTGRSKGAMLSHRNLESNARTLHRIWGFEPGDVLLHALPIYHVHGLFVALHCALLNGSTIHFLPQFEIDTVIDLLPKSTVMMGVPTFYTRLLADDRFDLERCGNMRLFISGSAPLLSETFDAFEARSAHRILERYGMSETGMITSNPLDGERRPGSVGPALPDVRVRVADDQGNVLAAGETGVLEVDGPNVFKGYWRMPEKTAAEFRDDGFFITGDLATLGEDGYVTIVGRAKDLIISGGLNVYPKEIEGYIDELAGIGESAVIGVPHPDFGEAVVAAATRSRENPDASEDAIIAELKDRLAGFKVPKHVFFLDELPRNTMGKVQKTLLRDRYATLFADQTK